MQFLHFSFGCGNFIWKIFHFELLIGATLSPFAIGVVLSVVPFENSAFWSYIFLGSFTLIACIPTFLLTSPPLLPKDIQQQKEEKEKQEVEKEQQEKPNEALGDNGKILSL
jgi:hypothetical protein